VYVAIVAEQLPPPKTAMVPEQVPWLGALPQEGSVQPRVSMGVPV